MPFNQTFNNTTNVYNVDGSLILTAESKPADLARQIAEVRAALGAEAGIAPAARDAAVAELDHAERESKAPAPRGATVQAHLERAGAAIEGATNVAGKAAKLAKTLFAIGSWAAAVLT